MSQYPEIIAARFGGSPVTADFLLAAEDAVAGLTCHVADEVMDMDLHVLLSSLTARDGILDELAELLKAVQGRIKQAPGNPDDAYEHLGEAVDDLVRGVNATVDRAASFLDPASTGVDS